MSSGTKLGQDVNRILYIKNLPYSITGEDLYDLFGKYGAIRQIRLGNTKETRGTAYVVYEIVNDSKQAFDNLNGFHLNERYIVVMYHQPEKQAQIAMKQAELAKREEELAAFKRANDIA
ncbi:RNA-binding domain-containing protein [Wallemia mellicola CBS 633.66]|uniref:RNA-binding domain-containing protein n=1 Tax=Wallemia mellicola (strain ATCC MYA-4683 / CBS 633.66) TaxID=671144 RepID=I4YDP3_WALMC|nr:RNA-binding domain-containing protein [Wallemia mellicola CBS 633.66]EIM22085.1 RNA-binding domain-containing protein [Wallemia mellicola CBS 633.66]|eukprot:XP_006957889.1 RNA-binding domain-containing protein [Wallemia mellicola CBS 633.66]